MKRTHIPCLVLCQFALAVISASAARAATPAEQADAFHARGLAAEQRGDLVAAENCYTLALRVIASHPAAMASLAELEEKLPVKVTPTASHTFERDRVEALNDGKEPSSSRDSSIPRFTWHPHQASFEWVQYDFAKTQAVEGCSVYWYHDNGGVKLPEFWKVLYLDEAGTWMPVDGQAPPPTMNAWNTCRFKSLRTKGLRLAVQLGRSSAGILEWKIIPSPDQAPPPLPRSAELRLDDLIPTTAKTGWGSLQVNRYMNLEGERTSQVVLDGKTCDHFLFAHAGSSISYKLPAGYSRFLALGISPTSPDIKEYSWSYKVLADQTEVFQSRPIGTYPDKKILIDVELPSGTRTITLITDANGDMRNDHAIWAYPRLIASTISAATLARLAQLETEYKAAGAAAAQAAHEKAMTDLRIKYVAAVKRAQEEAKKAGDTATSDVLHEELSRAQVGADVPEKDDPGAPATLVKLRGIYRQQAATAEKANADRMKPLLDRYDAELAALEASLTDKPDDLAAVKAAREQIAKQR